MDEVISREQIEEALTKQMPMEAHRIELGGDYYYRCHWISCNTEVNTWMQYCPKCGQKLIYESCTGATVRRRKWER